MKALVESEQDVVDAAVAWVAKRHRGLSAAEEQALAAWLREAGHARVFEKYARSWDSLARPRETGRADLLREKIARIERRRRVRRAVAGSTVALLLVSAVWWKTVPRGPASPEPARAVVILPRHERLPDGSVIDARADAEFAVDFSGAFRRVHLVKGEALFAVAKDAAHPFVVDAGGVEVRAVGTAFSVQLGADNVAVLVTEGKVAVDRAAPLSTDVPKTGLGIGSVALVQAGEQVVVERHADAARPSVQPVAAQEVSDRLAWRNPQVEFSGAPLSEVVATINRFSPVPYVVEDAALAKTELSGLFRADDTRAFERMLESGLGLRITRTPQRVLLQRAR